MKRIYVDERAIPTQMRVGNYWVQQWYNPDENVSLVMATFPVIDGRIQDGHMPIYNTATERPEMVTVKLLDFEERRVSGFVSDMEADVDLWERPLWLVVLAWLMVIGAAVMALILLVIWLRLR